MSDTKLGDLGNGWRRCMECAKWDVQCECDILSGLCPFDLVYVQETRKKLKRTSTGREVLNLFNHTYVRHSEPVLLVRTAGYGARESLNFPFVVEISHLEGKLTDYMLHVVVKNTTIFANGHVISRLHPRFAKCFYVAALEILENEPHDFMKSMWGYHDVVRLIRRSYRSSLTMP